MQRKLSWSDEVEQELKINESRDAIKDREQWILSKRIPNYWTEDNIDNVKVKAVKHWFGYNQDSTEEDTEDDECNEEQWNTVERKKKKVKTS